MKTIRVTFFVPVEIPSGWADLIGALLRQLPCNGKVQWVKKSPHPFDSGFYLITGFNIELDEPIKELPIGWEGILDAALMQLCLIYEEQNPTRVMWPSGSGEQILWAEPNEPTTNPDVFEITVSEREDYYGHNPNNPERDRLKKELKQAKLCDPRIPPGSVPGVER